MDCFIPQIVNEGKDFSAIYLATVNSTIRFYPYDNTTSIPADFDITSRPWYQLAMTNNSGHDIIITPIYLDVFDRNLMITMASPIITSQNIIGVMGFDISIDSIISSLKETQFLNSGYLFLLNKDYEFIYLSDAGYQDFFGKSKTDLGDFPNLNQSKTGVFSNINALLKGKVSYSSMSIEDSTYFISMQTMNTTGWILGSITSRDDILSSLTAIQQKTDETIDTFIFARILPIIFIITVFIIFIGIFFVNRFTNPIKELSITAETIAKGNLDINLPQARLDDEIGRLNSSFTNMVTKLRQSQEKLSSWNLELEKQVRQRTDQLNNKIADLETSEETNKIILDDLKHTIDDLKKAHVEINQKNSELEKTKYQLQNFNKQLEQKVQEKTKEIESILKQKDEFIHQLGHDLKNPLGLLINLLPILKKNVAEEKDKEILTVLGRNVNYMRSIVSKTLELARLNSPNTTLKYELYSLKDQLNEIIEKNTYLFDEKNIIVSEDLPENLMIEADRVLLEELFTNLLNNSVKYSPDRGEISINAKQDENEIMVSVKDSGIGMTEDQINKVFDEFYKVDSSNHDFNSSGLGMPISKRIVEKHGGKIWAESPGPKRGSTFFFTIPRKKGQEE